MLVMQPSFFPISLAAHPPSLVEYDWIEKENGAQSGAKPTREKDGKNSNNPNQPRDVEAESLIMDEFGLGFDMDSVAPLPTRAEVGLADNSVVFGSFCSPVKITSSMWLVWMNILKRVPSSLLWLYTGNDTRAEIALTNLRAEATMQGVAGERIVAAPYQPWKDHQERLSLIDLYLDTYPMNSFTAVAEALWSGVPAVTMSGTLIHQRTSKSVLLAVGCPQLVANNYRQYEDTAVAMVTDVTLWGSVDKRLLGWTRNSNAFFQTEQWGSQLDKMFTMLWQGLHLGKPPMHYITKTNPQT
eukprot:TRINITY_DN6573_c0_g1_i1.p1 TRINITY_DN6573_c0_g1~~TRINITY_DN6573_c0_g1_i1.p1  ORF type:complete len:327 (+),score=33.69 TRINITY_DN6573_c0_g1_i1:87-983(+)